MQLKVKVLNVWFPKEAGDDARVWYILNTCAGKAVGDMLWRPAEGERLVLEGEWGVRGGKRQFKFTAAMADIPVDPRDQLRYVCETTDGVGQGTEQLIWLEWGAQWWDSAKPGVVKGLNENRFRKFRNAMNAFELERDKSTAIAWLMGKGATMGLAVAAWLTWEKGTIGTVQDNCYILAHLPHYGFGDVDRLIAPGFNIVPDDPRRLRAAIVYAMHRATETGATLINWATLLRESIELLGGVASHEQLADETRELMTGEDQLRGMPDVLGIALTQDYENEQAILEYVG